MTLKLNFFFVGVYTRKTEMPHSVKLRLAMPGLNIGNWELAQLQPEISYLTLFFIIQMWTYAKVRIFALELSLLIETSLKFIKLVH